MPYFVRKIFAKLARKTRKQKTHAFLFVGVMLALCVLGNSLTFYYFDGAKNPKITFADSVWYSIISVTTIGYGDFYAQTAGARIGTVLFIICAGMAAFTAFLGMTVDWVIELNYKEQRGMMPVFSENHILLINFPSSARVCSIIEELISDPLHKNKEVVIVTDQIDVLPFEIKNISFVKGSPLEEQTFKRANIDKADVAIVLGPNYADPNTDSLVASIVSVLEHMKPTLKTVAECLDDNHELLFRSAHCDSIIFPLRIANNLIVQETQDTGISAFVDILTSNRRGETFFTTKVLEEPARKTSYIEFAHRMLDEGINLLCVVRGDFKYTSLKDLDLEKDDLFVYVTSARKEWKYFEMLLSAGAGRT